MADGHLERVSRAYGPETWGVYDLLDRSLGPRGPETMLTLGVALLAPDAHLLDVGCRDASHLVALVQATGARGVGMDPVGRLREQATTAVREAGLAELLLGQSLAIVAENLVEENVERAFRRAGLAVIRRDEIATEWREHAQERSQPASQAPLRLARLRRQRDRIVAEAGEDIHGHIESNLHWPVHQLLGKLMPTIYVLERPAA